MARRPGPTRRVQVVEVVDGRTRRHEDRLATEEPLEIRVDSPGRPTERFGVTMRTPGHDFELTAGLLFAEGIYKRRDDLRSIAYCTDADLTEEEEFNVVTAHLSSPPATAWTPRDVSSACGVCGKDSVSDVVAVAGPLLAGIRVDAAVLATLPDRLRKEQQVFATTGGLHAAGLFDGAGNALVVREDVGRHNAVDKAIGHCVLEQRALDASILCVSGRVAYEIVQKAAAAGIGFVVAVGAPSSLAVDVAKEVGISLVGFVREGRMVVYSHADRIVGAGGFPARPGR